LLSKYEGVNHYSCLAIQYCSDGWPRCHSLFFECCFVLWYARKLPLFLRTKFTKLAAGAVWICVVVGVPLGQLSAYVWAARAKRLNDAFLMTVIISPESHLHSYFFGVLIEREKRTRGGEERRQ
jgi:hypothetical protein